MRYWSTPYNGRYIREDGEICDISRVIKEDLNPQIICDEDIEVPKTVYQRLEKMMVGSSP